MINFNNEWLDKPYPELTDEQLLAVANFYQQWHDEEGHRSCVYMLALRSQLAIERERANRAEADAVEAWRQVHLFKTEAGGPDGFATWKDAAINERLRRVKAEAELTALRERMARLVGTIEPVAKVHINRTGGNVGIAWRAIGIDGSLPALADGEVLYVLRTALEDK